MCHEKDAWCAQREYSRSIPFYSEYKDNKDKEKGEKRMLCMIKNIIESLQTEA